MSAANPNKLQIEAMLAGQVYIDGLGNRRVVVVSDDDDGSYETVRVAFAGLDTTDSMRAQWIAECSVPYGSDPMPLLGIVVKTLHDNGFVLAVAPTGDPQRQERIGVRIVATIPFGATGLVWTPSPR